MGFHMSRFVYFPATTSLSTYVRWFHYDTRKCHFHYCILNLVASLCRAPPLLTCLPLPRCLVCVVRVPVPSPVCARLSLCSQSRRYPSPLIDIALTQIDDSLTHCDLERRSSDLPADSCLPALWRPRPRSDLWFIVLWSLPLCTGVTLNFFVMDVFACPRAISVSTTPLSSLLCFTSDIVDHFYRISVRFRPVFCVIISFPHFHFPAVPRYTTAYAHCS